MAADLQLPPGFRFHPTDEELVIHYLCRKCASQPIEVPIIAEIDLYKYHPWDLPDLALYGEKEWYFFSPRDRKYPNGSRPNRSAGCGYWKATGVDKPIGSPKPVGIKKALVFYAGKAPKGDKTNWIMHEYRLANVDRSARKNNKSSRLDDWILCRIYNKKGIKEKRHVSSREADNAATTTTTTTTTTIEEEEKKPVIKTSSPTIPPQVYNDTVYLNASDSVPKLHTDSSGSEHVASSEFTCEVQSNNQQKHSVWGNAFDLSFNYMDATTNLYDNTLVINNQFQSSYQMSSLQDLFMFPSELAKMENI